jgi:hypothetical protein
VTLSNVVTTTRDRLDEETGAFDGHATTEPAAT